MTEETQIPECCKKYDEIEDKICGLKSEIEELICVGVLGWHQNFVIYKITKVTPNQLGMGYCTVCGEEVEEFLPDISIKDIMMQI